MQQSFVYFCDGLILYPMATLTNSQLPVRRGDKPPNVTDSRRKHGHILLAINKKGRHTNLAIAFARRLNSTAKQRLKDIGSIVIQAAGQSSWLAQGLFI